MIPERIGPYLIETKVGAGGMGTVYRAFHAETEQEVALKVLPASLSQQEGFVVRFEREIDALRRLSNPNIVTFYDSGQVGDLSYFAMEFVEGETLTEYIRRKKRLPWDEVIDLSIQICSALKAAHDAGIIHRDLKPSNLLMDKNGQVKLTDFGVAQVFAEARLTMTGGIIGTAEYMSPEQARGSRASKQSDLYSLGTVMYAMLTGRPPFVGKTSTDVMHQHQYGQFDRPSRYVPEIPYWLDEIVCQLLEKKPANRFPDALVLSRRLQEVKNKVELSQSQETTLAPAHLREHPAQETNDDIILPHEEHIPEPGGATLMRDFMRAEYEREQHKSLLSRFFDNIFVLIASLILLIVGGYYWFSGGPSPEDRFDEGLAIMNQSEGPAWVRAREEVFEPLLKEDPERWGEAIKPHLQRIQVYELKQDLGIIKRKQRTQRSPRSEAERLLFLAHRYHELGESDRAEATLQALSNLLAGQKDQEPMYQLTRQLLDEVRSAQISRESRRQLIVAALKRATSLKETGQLDLAQEIWSSILLLYQDDELLQEEVQRARTLLDEAKQIEQISQRETPP